MMAIFTTEYRQQTNSTIGGRFMSVDYINGCVRYIKIMAIEYKTIVQIDRYFFIQYKTKVY